MNRKGFFDALSPHNPLNIRPIDIPVAADKDSIMGPSWLIRNIQKDPPDSIYLRFTLFRNFEHKTADALGESYLPVPGGRRGLGSFRAPPKMV